MTEADNTMIEGFIPRPSYSGPQWFVWKESAGFGLGLHIGWESSGRAVVEVLDTTEDAPGIETELYVFATSCDEEWSFRKEQDARLKFEILKNTVGGAR